MLEKYGEAPQQISRGIKKGDIIIPLEKKGDINTSRGINTSLGFEKYKMPQVPREDLNAGIQALQAKSPFEILGVSEDNTYGEITARYRELVKKLHPDVVSKKAGDFLDTFNSMTRRINEAYEELKDHVPPPKTLAEAACQGYSQQEFDLKEPVEQLSIMLTVLSEFALDDIFHTMGSDIALSVRIANESARIYTDLDSIQRAYRGEIGFRPLDGKPLPDVENILQTLKDVEIVKGWRAKLIYAPEAEEYIYSRREEEEYFTVYSVPMPIVAGREIPHYKRQHDGSASSYPRFWFDQFRKFNRIPDLETGQRLTSITRQKQQRIKRHGGFIGNLLNFIKPPSGMISKDGKENIEDLGRKEENVSVGEDKKPVVPQPTSKSPN